MKRDKLVEIKISKPLSEKVNVIVEKSDCFQTVKEFALTALLHGLIRALRERPSNDPRGA